MNAYEGFEASERSKRAKITVAVVVAEVCLNEHRSHHCNALIQVTLFN